MSESSLAQHTDRLTHPAHTEKSNDLPAVDAISHAMYLSALIKYEYCEVKDKLPSHIISLQQPPAGDEAPTRPKRPPGNRPTGAQRPSANKTRPQQPQPQPQTAPTSSSTVVEHTAKAPTQFAIPEHTALSTELVLRQRNKFQNKPKWHAPFELKRVLVGHQGWVRCVDVDASNDFFATGSVDNTIKIWDLASGELKITFTGHASTIRSVKISPKHPLLFSCSEDRTVKCFDLEKNMVTRQYFGHLSGITSLALHPTLDVIITGSRDKTIKLWDIRTKQAIRTLEGHREMVGALVALPVDPQVVSCSQDSTIRLWDIISGKTMTTIAHHRKSVRALIESPLENTIISASSDSIKKFKIPQGTFMHNYQHHPEIVNDICCNNDGVMAAGCDLGDIHLYDYYSGYKYQTITTPPQTGSLSSEAAIYACTFDQTGTRLITCEGDKTIKIYHMNENATPSTHPLVYDQYATFRS